MKTLPEIQVLKKINTPLSNTACFGKEPKFVALESHHY